MDELTKQLFELQDIEFRDFNAKLIPNVNKETIIGIRTPVMRTFAKEFAKDERKFEFLKQLPHHYYEENNLHAALIATISKDINVVLEYVEEFLPYIDNWATCDTFDLKIFKKYPDLIYTKVKEWINGSTTYTVRFGVVTALQYYLDEHFDPDMLEILANLHTEEYYINMAIAWYYSYALIKQYDSTICLFEKKSLDKWIQNKSIQKACESFRVPQEQKEYLKTLKIK